MDYSDNKDLEMANYKRLVFIIHHLINHPLNIQLDKVTLKIDKWHGHKTLQDKEQFENDEEYIESEKSPNDFSSSHSISSSNIDQSEILE